jgi:hypothetical protein
VSYRFCVLAALLAATALAGCDSFYRAIGKEKVVPDEFAVVSRAPLAIPPDFSLRPPRIGAQRPQEQAPVEQARQTVFRAGEDAKTNLPPAAEQRSPGEGMLLREAGAGGAPSNIRQLIDTDASSTNAMSDSFVDKLAFWRKEQKPGAPDAVIDPVQEAERLKDQKDQKDGKAPPPAAPLAGVPVIEKTKAGGSSTGWFGWLF